MPAADASSLLSKSLRSITLTKIRELELQRQTYEARKNKVLSDADSLNHDRYARVSRLLDGVTELYPGHADDNGIANIKRWLEQSRYDRSVPKDMVDSFDKQLRAKLEIQSRKLAMADLYSRLLTEWMSSPPSDSADLDEVGDEGDEEVVHVVESQKQRLQQLCDTFEEVVFTPKETDETAIEAYLDALFPGEKEVKALKDLRESIKSSSDLFLAEKEPFYTESLTNCIKGLLTEDLVSDEKQGILREFLENPIVLAEIADVLNMRYKDLANWNWHAGEEGIPVMPRQGLNGKYRIWMDEDVLQTIFVQFIGIRLCTILKPALKTLISCADVWNWDGDRRLTKEGANKLNYNMSTHRYSVATRASSKVVNYYRESDYLETFFLAQLPGTETSLQDGGGYDDDDSNSDDERNEKKSSYKQQLLRKIASEALLHRHLHGEVAVIQSDMQWYATALPHSTIFAIMRYVGFSDEWLTFFKKYLEPPLNLDRSSDDREPAGPRIRKRGVPMAHASEKFTGELVLFVMDLAVNKEAGMLLYRIHDDLWLCGEPSNCARAWTSMKECADIMGLEFNYKKTGSVYLVSESKSKDPKITATLPSGPVTIGFLILDKESGKWVIDQAQVDRHVKQLQKQLSTCNSVLSWVQTWNSCIGRFFSNTFGEPGFCFGSEHIDSILETHALIQRSIFGENGNVTDHLKAKICKQFDVSNLPEPFLYLPERLGGLGLRNPFIPLFLVRDALADAKKPDVVLDTFLKDEHEDYATQKKTFDEMSEQRHRRYFRNTYPDDEFIPSVHSKFFSYEECTYFRESTSARLGDIYKSLMMEPPQEDICVSAKVHAALRDVDMSSSRDLDPEKMWVVEMHSRELFEKFGGLSLVDKCYLPVGVLTMLRGKKVNWQMVL